LKPLYNRQLRGTREVWTWVIADDGAAPELAPLGQVPMSFESADCFGLYRTESAARRALTALAREERLCLKVLGLEAGAGSCFAYQLDRCAGACIEEEPLRRHTARLKMAFAAERLRPWPFEGPAGVRERGRNGRSQMHVFEDWRHLATISSEEELVEVEGLSAPRRAPFDLDVYRILCRHMRRARAVSWMSLGRAPDPEAHSADSDGAFELRRVLEP
jgi:DNA polymerase-3 subunit epsilon